MISKQGVNIFMNFFFHMKQFENEKLSIYRQILVIMIKNNSVMG